MLASVSDTESIVTTAPVGTSDSRPALTAVLIWVVVYRRRGPARWKPLDKAMLLSLMSRRSSSSWDKRRLGVGVGVGVPVGEELGEPNDMPRVPLTS